MRNRATVYELAEMNRVTGTQLALKITVRVREWAERERDSGE